MKRLVSVIVALILVLSCTEPMVDVRAAGARILAPFKSGYIPNDGSITLRLKPGFEFIRAGSEYAHQPFAGFHR